MIEPHGGKLVNRIAKREDKDRIFKDAESLFKIKLDTEHIQELHNIATGTFSPLEGFLTEKELTSVLKEMRLLSGIPWTVPIVLDFPGWMYEESIPKIDS